MCVILIGKITKQQHQLAKQRNGDGFSLYTQEQGLVKAPTANQVNDAIGKFGIWHYRIATSGKIDKNNIHPFEICGGEWLLYHNGVLGNGLGNKSDTHSLADTLYDVDISTAKTVIQSLSQGRRFVIASARNPHKFYIYGNWDCEAGVLFSHKLIDYRKRTVGYVSQGWASDPTTRQLGGKKYGKSLYDIS